MSKSSLHHRPITRTIREHDTDSIVESLKQDSKTTVVVTDPLLEIIEEAIPSNHEQLTREQLVNLVYSYFKLEDVEQRLSQTLMSSVIRNCNNSGMNDHTG